MTDELKQLLNTSRIERAAVVRNHASCFNTCLKRIHELQLFLDLRGHLTEKEKQEMKDQIKEAKIHKAKFVAIVKEGNRWI